MKHYVKPSFDSIELEPTNNCQSSETMGGDVEQPVSILLENILIVVMNQ